MRCVPRDVDHCMLLCSFVGSLILNLCSQGYVSRAIRDELGVNILALDWSTVQSQGAARRDKGAASTNTTHREPGTGSLTYKTLSINKDALLATTDEWLSQDLGKAKSRLEHDLSSEGLAPVLLLALHACGSLTLDILRAFCEQLRTPSPTWRPTAALVVGCCYNLLNIEGAAARWQSLSRS